MSDFSNKKVLVIGLARSGLAAVKLLLKLGADITVSESKPESEIKERDFLKENGVRLAPQTPDIFEENYDLAVKNPGINGNLWFIKRLRERNIPVITEIELAYRVSAKQFYIAVTGTNGKTTTSSLIYEILKKAFPGKAHVTGNIGTALCETVLENSLLTEGGHYIVLEISNFQLADIVDFKADVSVILNLAPDHIDFMGSEDNYYRSKCRVYENADENCVFLKNADDKIIEEYCSLLPVKAKTFTFSTENKADIYADGKNVYYNGKILFPLDIIRIVGRHNVQNVLVSVAAALTAGADEETIREAVADFRGVEHRIEFVREKDGVKYYNDSKGTNVDATVTALKAFSSPVILLAGGFEKGLSFEPLKAYLKNVKQVIGFGACGKRLIEELTGGTGILTENLPEALAQAEKLAKSGDTVLLSPTTSSFDQYSCFEERGEHFKELVNSL
ncbi:MAG: UDP-N-acetylmuramoyl-L-alanine--D-glutamate ligase [Oscillospiraceae bacterium]|nr:UDP-N-acetylmuramoyl-L-alanine--D-glutamate ligase [Oscillospiraceae bacterium]